MQLTTEEQRFIELKYRSRRIGEMSKGETQKWSYALLLKIHVITGWIIPAKEELMNILLDQFEKKLCESYPDLNPDEIEFAFRSKGTAVEDWGKSMNLNLIDQVLVPYKNERLYASRLEEQLQLVAPAAAMTSREIDYDFWKEMIQDEYRTFIRKEFSLHVWHDRKYYTLRKCGLLPFPKGFATWLYFFRKVMKGSTGTRLPPGADLAHYRFRDFREVRAIFYRPEDFRLCLEHVRRQAYWYVLRACRDCGIHDLWKEIAPE